MNLTESSPPVFIDHLSVVFMQEHSGFKSTWLLGIGICLPITIPNASGFVCKLTLAASSFGKLILIVLVLVFCKFN